MTERVVVYEKDRNTLTFLRSFFGKRRGLHAEFVDSIASFREALSRSGNENLLCIVALNELKKVAPVPSLPPIIAAISGDADVGIRSAIKDGADNYLLCPLCEEDLEFKIRNIRGRKRMLDHLKQENGVLQAVMELSYLVSSTLNPQEILFLIVKKISEIIAVTRCSIIRVNRSKRYAQVVSTFEDPNMRNIRIDVAKYPEIKRALTLREPVIVKDVTKDPLMERVRDVLSPLGIRSIVVIPIIFHEEVIGTLFLRTSRTTSAFTETEIKLCNAIANVSANALYNAFLFEKMEDEKSRLEKLAITDFMTGAYNIRYFYHRLTEEFSRSERYNLPLSCLMIDIDHFKAINDRYGHMTGDKVLREFAQVLKKLTRKSDVLVRYGGEEFIMLLTQTPAAGAAKKGEALRAFIEKYRFHGLKGGKGPTVSIGIASHPSPFIMSREDLITFADNALYKAKINGRNRVVAYQPDMKR